MRNEYRSKGGDCPYLSRPIAGFRSRLAPLHEAPWAPRCVSGAGSGAFAVRRRHAVDIRAGQVRYPPINRYKIDMFTSKLASTGVEFRESRETRSEGQRLEEDGLILGDRAWPMFSGAGGAHHWIAVAPHGSRDAMWRRSLPHCSSRISGGFGASRIRSQLTRNRIQKRRHLWPSYT